MSNNMDRHSSEPNNKRTFMKARGKRVIGTWATERQPNPTPKKHNCGYDNDWSDESKQGNRGASILEPLISRVVGDESERYTSKFH